MHLALAGAARPAAIGAQWRWPERAENLQVLPADFPPQRLRFFERNVDDHPEWAEGWESLGDVWAARGDRDQARRFYEKALELAPGNARVRRSLDAIR